LKTARAIHAAAASAKAAVKNGIACGFSHSSNAQNQAAPPTAIPENEVRSCDRPQTARPQAIARQMPANSHAKSIAAG